MIKGTDYTGITVGFYCHDGLGNFVMNKRGSACRDEQGKWDFGGGGLKFGETLDEGLCREVMEEYGVTPLQCEFLGFDQIFREHEGRPTHWISFRYKVLVNRDEVINGEPDKHDEIQWFSLDSLPLNLHSQIEKQLQQYAPLLRKK